MMALGTCRWARCSHSLCDHEEEQQPLIVQKNLREPGTWCTRLRNSVHLGDSGRQGRDRRPGQTFVEFHLLGLFLQVLLQSLVDLTSDLSSLLELGHLVLPRKQIHQHASKHWVCTSNEDEVSKITGTFIRASCRRSCSNFPACKMMDFRKSATSFFRVLISLSFRLHKLSKLSRTVSCPSEFRAFSSSYFSLAASTMDSKWVISSRFLVSS